MACRQWCRPSSPTTPPRGLRQPRTSESCSPRLCLSLSSSSTLTSRIFKNRLYGFRYCWWCLSKVL
ncbi:hypothetical protein BDA96_02G128200 [Sorghum bicolor]|uniref:Uncharacterized protein n=1 Tax=Sorghum bicolor TaxID=4558 RepID=A0A921RLN9_SORBI|nr:hypothetical protein BDA96_02G128200 [Sorghum bicolor]KAG0542715.1 hypothetical protein BDA96_02G128200 [Sorghum bicolor]